MIRTRLTVRREERAYLNRRTTHPAIVEWVEIRDFRGIEELHLQLAKPDDKTPWAVLIGENGHSKTSVLQALALLLAGDDGRQRLDIEDRAGLVRDGARKARITAQLRGEIEPRTLTITAGGRFEVEDEWLPAAIAAYGAARIPSSHRGLRERRPRATRPRIENLFDAASPLTAAERWLLELDEESFDYAGRSLRRLLLKPEETVLERGDRRVRLATQEGFEDLARLSDGYRSTVALAADIMSFFMTRYGSMDAAEGIVLVDELSAHLHPSWQMRVVESFRTAFPRLQFVVTTHDPLSLRGLDRGDEVIVLRKTRQNRVYALPPEELPPVGAMRVDELLTSEVFGLNSTVDPELEEDFDRYYELLAKGASGPKDQEEIEELKRKLDGLRQLGTTRRERLALETADEYLANRRELADSGKREELLEETKEELRAIWTGEGS